MSAIYTTKDNVLRSNDRHYVGNKMSFGHKLQGLQVSKPRIVDLATIGAGASV
jgi:hypothetical protein